MKTTQASPLFLILGAALLCITPACRPDVDATTAGAGKAAAKPAGTVRGPTKERVMQRAQERWSKVAAKDLVAAYDFQAPEAKRELSLSEYLGRLQKHRYENARVEEVVAIKDNEAYVRASVLWTPIDEVTRRVKLEPGQTLTQDITMIETWRFVDGDWCYVRPQIDTDFFQDHPELLRQDETKQAKPDDAPKPGSEKH